MAELEIAKKVLRIKRTEAIVTIQSVPSISSVLYV